MAMDTQRSTRHRSLGIGPEAQSARIKYPAMSERRNSAPLTSCLQQSSGQALQDLSALQQSLPVHQSVRDKAILDVKNNCPITNLVVLGNTRVGKTTFIRNVLDLEEPPSRSIVSRNIQFNNAQHSLRFFEIGLCDIDLTNGKFLGWPKPVGTELFSPIDGVLCLYNVTKEDSINGLPEILYHLTKAKLPVTLVACFVDAHISEQEVGIAFIDRIVRLFPSVKFSESTSLSSESAKICVLNALRNIENYHRVRESMSDDTDDEDVQSQPEITSNNTVNAAISQLTPTDSQTPSSDISDALAKPEVDEKEEQDIALISPDSFYQQTTLENAQRALDTMLKSQEQPRSDDDEAVDLSPTMSQGQFEMSKLKQTISNDNEGGVPLDALVDRLLQMPTTKNDAKFVPAFLCLYRMFTTPRRLLNAIIHRFEQTDSSDLVVLTKVGELLRYLQVLAQWTANYPGDFAESSLRRLALSFVHDIEQRKSFAPAAREIFDNLLTIIMDDDLDWAYKDSDTHEKHDSKSTIASTLSKKESSQVTESDQSEDDPDVRRRSIRNSGTGSIASSLVRSSTTSSQSATNLSNLDSAREQSKLLKAVPRIPLTKVQWHQFMAIPSEELAREITRMDWTMYSAIRARDFLRHVSLPSQRRARMRHADTIGMMVKHFNHLALFVSGMILLRDKPKHRAKILEKFMDLAWKVRQLNNYNSLGAIVAGITGPEIARLRQTYDLVPVEIQKQFLRLTVLMSTSRSYTAYRMAWENSFNERIPFVPLVRQDLTLAATANPTFIGQNINWKKFEIMGDVIVGVQRSHDQPYAFHEKTQRSHEITRLVLETKIIGETEDSVDPRGELYDRSVRLEPQSGMDSRKSIANFGVKRTMTGMFRS